MWRYGKTRKTILVLLFCASLLLSSVTVYAEKPEIAAKAALLIELNSDLILFEQNADATVYPASLTKIMTALLILENCKLTDTVTVSETSLQNLDEQGSSAGLLAGETLTVEELLYCIMISSANEGCNVAAELVDGSLEAFIAHMNKRAEELGCTGTHFVNAHGLHNEDHYTTARDLSRIVREALKNNEFKKIVSTSNHTVPETNLSGPRNLTTTNKMIIKSAANPYYDSRVTGVKTGYTTPAGRCLIATAESGKMSLLSIVCGCETRVLESGDLEFGSFPETEKLLNYAFNDFTYQVVLSTLYPVAEMPVSRSSGANFVSLAPKEELSVLLPSDYDKDKLSYDIKLLSENGVTAPVAAGDELGEVTVRYNGRELGSEKLVAIARVDRATMFSFLKTGLGSTQNWLRLILLLLILAAVVALILFLLIRSAKKKKAGRRQRRFKRVPNDFGKSDWFQREDPS